MNAKLFAVICVLVAGAIIAIAIRSNSGRGSAGVETPAEAAASAAEFGQLAAEHERLASLRDEAHSKIGDDADAVALTNDALSDEEWMKQGPSANPEIPDADGQMMPRFLEFAKRHPRSPLAFDALFLVILRGGPQTADVHGKPWQAKEQALNVLWENHSADPRMIHIFDLLGGSLPSEKTEAFLKQSMQPGQDETIRAAAAFHLARYYHSFAKSHKRTVEIAAKPQLKNFERYWKIVVSPYVAKFPLDQNKNADTIDMLLATVVEEFPAAQAADWTLTGSHKRHVEPAPFAQSKTYADLARAMLFEVNNITPGKPAPEIVGTDVDGQTFRLSDYRGKVVLLSFSADWCSDCQKIYPIKRNLVEKYLDRPFVLLSVNRDDTLDDLKASTASGQTTWRCWWDGRDGPINHAWNNGGIPDVYLLDHEHIIQDVALARFTNQDEFERAIEPLLHNAANLELIPEPSGTVPILRRPPEQNGTVPISETVLE